jgi:hypothetical protein
VSTSPPPVPPETPPASTAAAPEAAAAPRKKPGIGTIITLTLSWIVAIVWVLAVIGIWSEPAPASGVRGKNGLDPAGLAGFLIGSALLPGLAMVLVQTARARGRRRGTRILQAILIVSWSLLIVSVFRTPRGFGNSSMRQTKAGLKALADTMQQVVPEPGAPSTVATPTVDPATLGDYGLVVAIMQKYIAKIQSTAKAYELAVNDIGISTVLVPSNLGTPEGRAASKAKLTACTKELERYKSAYESVVREARDSIDALPLDRAVVSGLRRDFENGLSRVRPMMERNFAYEADVLDETLAVVDHLASVGDNVRFNGRGLVFDLDSDKFLYNASIARIRSIAAREAALEAEMQRGMAESRDRLRAAAADPASLTRQSAPAKAVHDAVRIQPDGAVLVNDVPLAWPPTIDSLRHTFGEPRTTHTDDLTYTVWDERGVFAISTGEDPTVDEIGFLLNINPSADFFPRSASAAVSVFGTSVSETATPLSLNRALGDRHFRCVNEERAIWRLDLGEDRWIAMFLGDGSCDTIRVVVVRPEQPEPEPPPQKPATTPRF